MPLQICRCCAGKMTASSPRNPNVCVACEQLLDDDTANLNTLLASVVNSPADARTPRDKRPVPR
ncbi:MAG TPA: hypothetical protein VK846_01545 [Candidatus Limnocylindria bacterium]|nr:hypothetical protein [Candidatus Limnocylindria bacterium]